MAIAHTFRAGGTSLQSSGLPQSSVGILQDAWDNDKDVEIERRTCAAVAEVQRATPGCLGYTQQTWNERNQDGDCAYVQGWKDFAAEQLTAAKISRYSKSAWDNHKDVEIERRTGAEMAEEQRATPGQLGYTQQTWNEQNHDGDCAYVKGRRDLAAEQRTAARLCGYSKSAGDNDKDVEIERRTWAEMS